LATPGTDDQRVHTTLVVEAEAEATTSATGLALGCTTCAPT
jgi:hypothetical protein